MNLRTLCVASLALIVSWSGTAIAQQVSTDYHLYESVGVNTHLGQGNSPYNSPVQIETDLSTVSIPGVRDSLGALGSQAQTNVQQLFGSQWGTLHSGSILTSKLAEPIQIR